jgi:hypothetical protein
VEFSEEGKKEILQTYVFLTLDDVLDGDFRPIQ